MSAADRGQILQHGLSEERVRKQLELLVNPPAGLELLRPALVDDGIVRIEDARHGELLTLYDRAADEGRFTKFVPASGAASRMFKSLAAMGFGAASSEDRTAWNRWLRNIERFPFHGELASYLEKQGKTLGDAVAQADAATLLPALLEDEGLNYLRRPKGLVPFHRYSGEHTRETRTPFDEHLAEAARHIRDQAGRCRLHLTILEQHEELFRQELEAKRESLESRLGASFDVSFSFQEPATDTVAADPNGNLFRERDGRLLIRPGGHGALIRNVARLGADLLFIKNIDNVVPDGRRDVVVLWKKLLGGYLLALEQELVRLLGENDRGDDWIQSARAFLRDGLRLPESVIPSSVESLVERLDRPLRVCGVVPVTGEPGGGPFWIRDPRDGESLQIVETSQIDAAQAEILKRSTHFNPVDLVCRLRDHRGRCFELERFIDPEAIFVANKSHEGRLLRTLEHPGLWNGAMAFWNTVFLEVPGDTFAPVKTVLDLLRDEHQT